MKNNALCFNLFFSSSRWKIVSGKLVMYARGAGLSSCPPFFRSKLKGTFSAAAGIASSCFLATIRCFLSLAMLAPHDFNHLLNNVII